MSVPSLAELRLAVGRKGYPLRQKELADLAKIDPSYVSALEAGRRKPSPYVLALLADALGVSRAQFSASVEETLRRYQLGEEQIRY